MRQKKLKHVNLEVMAELGALTSFQKVNVSDYEIVHLEIGSGKGQFIANLAKDNPNELFIALERNINVCYRIAEKKVEENLNNLVVILDDSVNIFEYLNPHTVDFIYLNFSDPWPKARHHKRRLSYQPFLDLYKELLNPKGILQLRTDHQSFFEDSVEYLEGNFNLIDINRNYQSDKYFTEYEEKKRKKGKIYQVKGSVLNE